MREIKFRAWNKKNKKWLAFDEHEVDVDYTLTDNYWKMFFVEDDNTAITQYTGLKDKNRKEIYEGDIVENLNYSGYPECVKNMTIDEKIEKGWIRVVEWQTLIDEEYGSNISGFLFAQISTNYKIIGNIYENPKMIKES